MKYIPLVVSALLLFSIAAAAEITAEKQTKKQITAEGPLCVGMTKEELFRIYSPSLQKSYRKVGSQEWITFTDNSAQESGGMIIFYLRNRVVRGWEKSSSSK